MTFDKVFLQCFNVVENGLNKLDNPQVSDIDPLFTGAIATFLGQFDYFESEYSRIADNIKRGVYGKEK